MNLSIQISPKERRFPFLCHQAKTLITSAPRASTIKSQGAKATPREREKKKQDARGLPQKERERRIENSQSSRQAKRNRREERPRERIEFVAQEGRAGRRDDHVKALLTHNWE
ncbi:MAG: hypothetical protein IPI03_19645 [Rubrivivax sp.]|nr:hypothetical protein [Rubrivivax sp.]